MKTATTAQRLQELMEERGLRQRDIINLVHAIDPNFMLNRNDLSQYVNGKVEPGREKLAMLCRALQVTEPWLMGYNAEKELLPPGAGTIPPTKPLSQLDTEACSTVPEWFQADFTLVCPDDSMTGARLCKGDTVCIRTQAEVESGQIAAVLIDDKAVLKRVRYLPNGSVALWPENPAYEPLIFTESDTDKIKILGLATNFISRIQ